MGDLGQHLGRAERDEEAFARERIVEAGGIPGEEHPAVARLGHAVGERPHRHQRARGTHALKARPEVAELLEPRLDE